MGGGGRGGEQGCQGGRVPGATSGISDLLLFPIECVPATVSYVKPRCEGLKSIMLHKVWISNLLVITLDTDRGGPRPLAKPLLVSIIFLQ